MSENDKLVVYSETGVLKICSAAPEPIYTIPLVAASKHGEDLVFGECALKKDESWKLTWLTGGTDNDLLEDLFRFVCLQPEVKKALEICNVIIAVLDFHWVDYFPSPYYKISLKSRDKGKYFALGLPFTSVLPASMKMVAMGEDSLYQKEGRSYSFNISGNFTMLGIYDEMRKSFARVKYVKVGFDTIVDHFIKLLCEKGYNITDTRDRLFCHKLVMDYCYVALDFDKELERIEKLDGPLHEITLEDGSILELGKECIMATEVLFNPGLVGMDEESAMSLILNQEFMPLLEAQLPPEIFEAIKDKYPTVVLTGACATKLKGLEERIQREIGKVNQMYLRNPYPVIKSYVRDDAISWLVRTLED
mmetsp:Transcript_14788/g.16728  ORF Transcript_14788/g.16728 Transcript_14788/m.16728 type:complete len:363 (+) Transcript_14788:62-1150(+)